MTAHTGQPDDWSRWRQAARLESVDAALRSLSRELDQIIRQRGPICWASGMCCDFDAFDHKLYATGLEIAWLVMKLPWQTRVDDDWAKRLSPTGKCPLQINGLCGVSNLRPLGCRIYFCHRGSAAWQHELYEQFLGRLRELHEKIDVPYRYMEWRTGLAAALAAGPAPPADGKM
jgi:Fe-S-cluster containining protein